VKKLLFIALICFGNFAFAHNGNSGEEEQPVEFVGQVIDAADGQVITGATIQLVGTDIKVMSDEDGRFVLELLPSQAGELELSFVSFATKRVEIDLSNTSTTIAISER